MCHSCVATQKKMHFFAKNVAYIGEYYCFFIYKL